MPSLSSVRQFLGMEPVEVLPGFTRSTRGPALPVCDRCGALVAFEGQQVHLTWHTSQPGG